jgi:hypothetical protein
MGSTSSSLSGARAAVAARQDRLKEVLAWKHEADRYADLLEYVADALATRHPDFASGLPPNMLLAFDPADKRKNYLEMQAALSDLRLRERAVLGRAFAGAMEKTANDPQGFVFMSARLDSKPEWVYVFGSSKKVGRPELVSRIIPQLMSGAMAFYEKRKCLVVIDRDKISYEVALSRADFQPTQADFENGQRLFGRLRVTSAPLQLVP